MKTLADVLEHEIQDVYDAETQLTKALPKLAKHANDEKLRIGFEEHLAQTEEHVARIKEAAHLVGVDYKGTPCKGIKGLIEEGAELLKKDANPAVDVALIGAAQRVEHYEIAAYGTLIAHAKLLGHDEVVDLLSLTLQEEEDTDKKLSDLADTQINEDALGLE